MKKKVALIDDDEGPILYYQMALQDADFEIMRLRTFKDALEYIDAPDQKPDFWVVDVMMSIRDDSLKVDDVEVTRSTSLGLGAGLLLYKKIKQQDPKTPVILLTSLAAPDLLNDIEATMQNEDTCESKLDLLPKNLVELVRNRI
jgi:DNA-binding NtrC family response regulator